MHKFILRHKLISALQDINLRGFRRMAHALPGLLIPEPRGVLTIRTLHGFSLQVDPARDQGVERSLYYTGTYEKGTLWIMGKILEEGDTFVDVGANIGLMSLFAARLVGTSGRVVAFEPNPHTAEIMRRNMALNQLGNIELLEAAIGEREGKARIYDNWDSNRGSASLIRPGKEADSYEVPVISLSGHFGDDHEIDLIKIDTEGFELQALMGAAAIVSGEEPPMLIVECSRERGSTEAASAPDLYRFLKGLGHYRLFRSIGGKSRTSKLVEVNSESDLPHHDNIYCFTERHLRHISRKVFRGRLEVTQS